MFQVVFLVIVSIHLGVLPVIDVERLLLLVDVVLLGLADDVDVSRLRSEQSLHFGSITDSAIDYSTKRVKQINVSP